MTTSTTLKMPGTPKPWMNAAMRTMLGLPGLRRLLGRMFAVITVTGAKSGRKYSTPIQYLRFDGDYVVLSERHRVWWRNFRTRPEVTLTTGARTITGRARIAEGDEAHQVLTVCLTANPRVAKYYGIKTDDRAAIDPADIDRLSELVVPIVITPAT
ncbi:MAG: nitroreductase family deazaflavin-dependent oxidoreductase [Acidimicrobiia bacterium]|nr:nitroreductase family deazaflavin-dependent oxidoreductase [Acidimicrobiia bacterium]